MSIVYNTTEIARRMKMLDRRVSPEQPQQTAAAGIVRSQPAAHLIYFDPGSCALSPGGRSIIYNLPWTGAPGILVVGHTDNVGLFVDNKILSSRRAEAVQAFMIRIGVPAARITIDSKGQSQPRVATPLQTDCQENRRCEIFVHP